MYITTLFKDNIYYLHVMTNKSHNTFLKLRAYIYIKNAIKIILSCVVINRKIGMRIIMKKNN